MQLPLILYLQILNAALKCLRRTKYFMLINNFSNIKYKSQQISLLSIL